jgi:hypothetical protein
VGVHVGPLDDPGRYLFEGDAKPVGRGGEGFVYRGRRVSDGYAVAVKQLTTVSLDEWARHAHRVGLLEQVVHPHLGRHLDAFLGPHPFSGPTPDAEEFDIPYTVMAWVDGVDLADVAGEADAATLFGWIRDVAHAARALHRLPTPTGVGIVHRDIKPSNVRITDTGAVLIDFGIARPAGTATTTMAAGAPGWIPPEALGRGTPGARGDTWQIAGLAAWALLDDPPGALPGDDTVTRLEDALRRRAVPRPRRVARQLTRALAADPRDRPADAATWADGLATAVRPPPTGGRPVAALALAAVLVVLVAGGALATGRLTSGPTTDPTGAPPAPAPPPPGPRAELVGADADPAAFDVGAPVKLSLRADAVPGLARLDVVPLAGDTPWTFADATVAPGPAGDHEVTLVVRAHPTRYPETMSGLLVRWLAADGAELGEHRIPLALRFAPPIPGAENCRRYEPATVAIEPDVTRWRLAAAGAVLLSNIGTRGDAEHLASVAAAADELCVIGPPDGRFLPIQYWKRGGHLVGSLPPAPARAGARCTPYDPAALTVQDDLSVASRGTQLVILGDRADADQALALARHHRRMCVVGRSMPESTDGARLAAFTYWQ